MVSHTLVDGLGAANSGHNLQNWLVVGMRRLGGWIKSGSFIRGTLRLSYQLGRLCALYKLVIRTTNINSLGCVQCLRPPGHQQGCMIPFWIRLLTRSATGLVSFGFMQFDKFSLALKNWIQGQSPGTFLVSFHLGYQPHLYVRCRNFMKGMPLLLNNLVQLVLFYYIKSNTLRRDLVESSNESL